MAGTFRYTYIRKQIKSQRVCTYSSRESNNELWGQESDQKNITRHSEIYIENIEHKIRRKYLNFE